jgi:cyclopropane-fatty-acyl-phospholipid synthase
MDILELGCGWGSLSLYMAKRYPGSRIVALSNSRSQGEYIRNAARAHRYDNLEVLTEDMNRFTSTARFDRIVSVEMFEHMRNWQSLFKRVSDWLHADGQFFMHIFAHRNAPYYFEDRDANDWMSRHFFSGGIMPSLDLPLFIQNHLAIRERWIWDGRHYEKTCNAWLNNMDRNKDELWPLIENIYGCDFAKIWWMRWRMFFMACAELFGYQNGQEWMVGHYLFDKQAEI